MLLQATAFVIARLYLHRTPFGVIPAKAGIQFENMRIGWIPAFAGMTEREAMSAQVLAPGQQGGPQ
jgi:hypothetical protein